MMIHQKPRIAVVGSGISGLTAAYRLSQDFEVTVYEQNSWIGGHTHTVDVYLDDQAYAIDTGFIVFNEWTYPRFLNLLNEIGVQHQNTDMSFSVSSERTGIEYAGDNLATLFAQKRRLLSPQYYKFLLDILRFNKAAIRDLESDIIRTDTTLQHYLMNRGFGRLFESHYLLPMAAAIWSSDTLDVLQMPALFFIRFFKNHGLLSVRHRPQWFSLPGGSSSYIKPLIRSFSDRIRLNTAVTSVRQTEHVVSVECASGKELFDGVVLAGHTDQISQLIDESFQPLKKYLCRIPYAENDVVLHTDHTQMPANRKAWASWNYRMQDNPLSKGAVVTYDMNRLQNIGGPHEFFVTLNNTAKIRNELILGQWTYSHPQFGPGSLETQSKILAQNVGRRIVVAGAWSRNGFHEDGVVSGESAASELSKTLGIE